MSSVVADVKISDRISLGMEGLYYFFDEGNGSIFNPDTGKPIGLLEDDNEFLVARARLTIHLAPAVERLK